MLALACKSANLAVQNIFDEIGFNPEKEVLDTERADAAFGTISIMASVIIGKLVTPMDAQEIPKACDHIVSQALGMVKASQDALVQLKKQAEENKSPIILPKKGS